MKGIGPATASAILSLYDPIAEPFLSDEAYEAIGLGKAEYTVKGWEKFRTAMTERVEAGAWESMEDLEKACWSWRVRSRYGGGEERKAETTKKEETKRKAEVGGDDASEDTSTAQPSRVKKSKS